MDATLSLCATPISGDIIVHLRITIDTAGLVVAGLQRPSGWSQGFQRGSGWCQGCRTTSPDRIELGGATAIVWRRTFGHADKAKIPG
jgi:hypothetical protein